MQDYKKLFVWQKAHQLALDAYADSATYLAHRPALGVARSGPWCRDLDSVEYR